MSDSHWKRRLGAGVTAAGVDLFAVLADRIMTIGELGALKTGDTIMFSAGADPRVELRSGHSPVAKGRVGRLGETIAVKLDAGVNAERIVQDLEDAA